MRYLRHRHNQSLSFLFFFSSRRRHTRSLCDWSSEVCSSDLTISPLRLRVPSLTVICGSGPVSACSPDHTYASAPTFFLYSQFTISTAFETHPAPASCAKNRRCVLPLAPNSTSGKSIVLSRPCLITAHARSNAVGILNSCAKTFIVPSGSTPKRELAKPSGTSPI